MTKTATSIKLDSDALGGLVQHIRHSTTDQAEATMLVPTAHFTSADRAALELDLLRRLPLVVGHVSEIPDAGAFVTRDLLGVPLLIVRQKNGGVAVFRNMCRHRGGQVETAPSGRRSIFMCGYHGWSYAAEAGTLQRVPYEETSGGVDHACNSLIAFPSDVRHGLIFATLSDSPQADVKAFLGSDVEAQFAPWDLEKSIVYMEHVMDMPINWKLVMDGAIDSLHAQFLHPKPGGVGSRSVNHATVFREFGRHGKMIMARSRLKTLLDAGEEPSATSNYMASVMMMYPNNIVVEAPDHIELWSLWPDIADPTRCTVKIRFMVRPEILSPEMEARINKSWDILRDAATEEDFPMEETIQKNAQAWPGGAYRYGRNEKPAQHLHRQLFADIVGGVADTGTIRFI